MKRLLQLAETIIPRRRQTAQLSFSGMFRKFKEVLSVNNQILEKIAEANDKLSGDYIFDQHYIRITCSEIIELVERLVYGLESLAPGKYPTLRQYFTTIRENIEDELSGEKRLISTDFIQHYKNISRDVIDEVGGKNAHLAELQNVLGMEIPPGFAITAAAFYAFLEQNDLHNLIALTCENWRQGMMTLQQASSHIQKHILVSSPPRKLVRDMNEAMTSIGHGQQLAMRSSGWGEDGEHSFAGQYKTVLGVTEANACQAYQQVVASLYGESAMAYRHQKGYRDDELVMPVACQTMIDARISGVMYTYDPVVPEDETVLINAAWGLGSPIVSGKATVDSYTIKRDAAHQIIAVNIVRKEKQLQLTVDGPREVFVNEDHQTMACLTVDQVQEIYRLGLQIEKYYRKPQDIEFCIDQQGKVIILQCRNLAIQTRQACDASALAAVVKNYPIILEGKGDIAQKGIASGPVCKVGHDSDFESFPEGAILVARYASPLLAKLLPKAAAILTDVGSAAGHLATVAREFRIPTLLNCQDVSTLLEDGRIITVDAEERIIYQGAIKELQFYCFTEEAIEETWEYRLLRRLLRRIEPLNLIDPAEKDFVPEACRTLHDITRFVHEKAVQSLIDYNFYGKHSRGAMAGKLQWSIPLDMVMIDVGGGLAPGCGKKIPPDAILSLPMLAILKGLTVKGAWDNEPMPVDFGSFMSSLTRTASPELASPKYLGQNLAVLSHEYANISLRLGYHFTMVDSFVSDNINDNYIYFRFFGGVTDERRRSRRARFLADILATHDFRVELHGDLVVGRIKKIDRDGVLSRLHLLGVLIGFTRQLDVLMVSDGRIADYTEKINKLLEDNHEQ